MLGPLLLAFQVQAAADFNRLVAASESPLRDLTLDSLAGGRADLADQRGRVVLVHFFATYCEPCRPEMASLDRLAARFGTDGVTVLAVSVAEPEARLSRFFADAPVRFPVLLDRDRVASRNWGVEALPTTFVLDRGLTPRLQVRGDLDWQAPEVEGQIASLLDSPAPDLPAPGHTGSQRDVTRTTEGG